MKLHLLTPNRSLNKAYLKEKVSRNNIEAFKTNLKTLLSKIDEKESEEHHKYPVTDFLKDTWYKDRYEINTKDRTDFVIHNGKTTADTVGVIIEVKSPSNQSEMISEAKPNKKAMHELILYYLRERVDNNQIEVKHLIITNIWEWYIFDEAWFEKNIFRSRLKKEYEIYKLSGKDTKFFFDSLAKPFLDELDDPIECAFFDFKDYGKTLRNNNKADDNKLIALYKLLSPVHLLKQPFANDSNSLDTKFYAELLHIIGLEEIKDGGKKLIQRKDKPDSASLLENTIMKLQDKDCLRNITNPSAYGIGSKEQLFNVALELCITWINRVLFIKLLEGQLVTYHKGDKDYLFLNTKVVFDYDELNNLFFQVLAERAGNRHDHLKEKFSKIPYLNSSLFDRTLLERETIEIGSLDNRLELPIASGTVLKNDVGKKKTNKLQTLQYLFEFLDAYDFSSDGGEEIQEENKNLINASVLGLIFEKINGYKDGSFFTPGFVTMYMCRETIRRAVLQKFNDAKGWQCETIEQLHDKTTDKKEANAIINSLKICDPAVGSGHFLVSALNELIAIKSELGILLDRENKWLRDYALEVVNDELIVTVEGNLLDYSPKSKESQRIQEALFHEKETIIENCLFGVDINPNSVKICRLRLWIELLKNAYYTKESNFTELETLPNIDINIKCGNSLISRFALDADLSKALKKSKWTIDSYRIAVQTYRNAESKEEKREMEELIENIKRNFRIEIGVNDPKLERKNKLAGELFNLLSQKQLFGETKAETKARKQKQEKLETEITKLETQIEEIKSNKVYENAFEWRFEFPEVLDNDGNFIGFDVVIGNPPYILVQNLGNKPIFDYYKEEYYTAVYKIDTYQLFYEKGYTLLNANGFLSYITPNTFLKNKHSKNLREILLNHRIIEIINFYVQVFEDASVDTLILNSQKKYFDANEIKFKPFNINKKEIDTNSFQYYKQKNFLKDALELEFNIDSNDATIFNKLKTGTTTLSEIGRAYFGIQTFDRKRYVSKEKINTDYYPVVDGENIKRYYCNSPLEYVLFNKTAIKSGGNENVYNKKRIAVRQIGKYPEGTLIEAGIMTLNTVYNIFLYDSKVPLEYVLGIINSNLIRFFWTKKYFDNKSTFPKIKKAPLESIPFILSNREIQEKITDLVHEILELKKYPNTVTIDLEKEIDQLVYQLYNLTEEEIKIVEGV